MWVKGSQSSVPLIVLFCCFFKAICYTYTAIKLVTTHTCLQNNSHPTHHCKRNKILSKLIYEYTCMAKFKIMWNVGNNLGWSHLNATTVFVKFHISESIYTRRNVNRCDFISISQLHLRIPTNTFSEDANQIDHYALVNIDYICLRVHRYTTNDARYFDVHCANCWGVPHLLAPIVSVSIFYAREMSCCVAQWSNEIGPYMTYISDERYGQYSHVILPAISWHWFRQYLCTHDTNRKSGKYNISLYKYIWCLLLKYIYIYIWLNR